MNIYWHRRDLRIADNAALYHALKSDQPTQPIFIFDTDILSRLPMSDDARVTFIHHSVTKLQAEYRDLGSELWVFHGAPIDIWRDLLDHHNITACYTNRDYEPSAKARDHDIKRLLTDRNVAWHDYKDQVLFEAHEITKPNGDQYAVYTPYSKTWKNTVRKRYTSSETGGLELFYLKQYPCGKHLKNLHQTDDLKDIPSLEAFGFQESTLTIPPPIISDTLLKNYAQTRDFPALPNGTSHLGIHLRFGTLSIRTLAKRAWAMSEVFLNQLIWRDFYAAILDQQPQLPYQSYKPAYDLINWRNDEDEFEAWCAGMTGYPLVDAGMRQLNATGYMHNRVRMVTASFLTKHLLIDWRWGEQYFAARLLDFDQSNNVNGWQWAAGCGTDAAPYFRIFNPTSQQQKFDPDFDYIKRWVPEFGTSKYPSPIVVHKTARELCLKTYKEALAIDKA